MLFICESKCEFVKKECTSLVDIGYNIKEALSCHCPITIKIQEYSASEDDIRHDTNPFDMDDPFYPLFNSLSWHGSLLTDVSSDGKKCKFSLLPCAQYVSIGESYEDKEFLALAEIKSGKIKITALW